MKLIEPSVEILEQSSRLDGIYKQIEIAGRTCYKSEDNITETSAKDFVNRMIKSGHGAMLEHGTVYLSIPELRDMNKTWNFYKNNKYSKTNTHQNIDNDGKTEPLILKVTTNFRVLIENNRLDDLQYICEPTEYHEKRITAKFICDRGVSHELVRHRVFSFAQESTRYCNYSKDKFGNELTFIKPSWLDMKDKDENREVSRLWNIDLLDICSLILEEESLDNRDTFLGSLMMSEYSYSNLLKNGATPQLARQVLPNALKTEIVMTGFESDWKEFFKLRCDKTAHPDMQVLANKLKGLMNEEK